LSSRHLNFTQSLGKASSIESREPSSRFINARTEKTKIIIARSNFRRIGANGNAFIVVANVRLEQDVLEGKKKRDKVVMGCRFLEGGGRAKD